MYYGKEPEKREKETLRLQKTSVIDGYVMKLIDVDLKKQAHLTILPGSGKTLSSVSNFSLHIPIEKRAIKLNIDKISKKINETEEKIEKLNEIIEKLEKFVKNMKSVCLITFAWLTLKNSFFSGLSKTIARDYVMRGPDGKSGWYAYCEENSGKGKLHKLSLIHI